MKAAVLSLSANVLMVFNYLLLWYNEVEMLQGSLKGNIKIK